MIHQPKPGDRVRANRDLWQETSDCHPHSLYAAKGDELVIRDLTPGAAWTFVLGVSHPERTDAMFACAPEELDPIDEVQDVR